MDNRDRAQIRLLGRYRLIVTMVHIDTLESLYNDKKPHTCKILDDLQRWGLVSYNTDNVLYRTILGEAYLRYVARLKEDEIIINMKRDIVQMEQKLNEMRNRHRTKRV